MEHVVHRCYLACQQRTQRVSAEGRCKRFMVTCIQLRAKQIYLYSQQDSGPVESAIICIEGLLGWYAADCLSSAASSLLSLTPDPDTSWRF